MVWAIARNCLTGLLAVPIAAFFGFVGWSKAFAPMLELALHHSWTVHLPEGLGRAVGWSEMTLAVGLLLALVPAYRRICAISALVLVANQAAASWVHLANGEAGALPQNAVLIVFLLVLAVLTRHNRNVP